MITNIPELVEMILDECQKKSVPSDEDLQALSRLVTAIIFPFPRIPGPLFIPVMSRNVPACVELIIVRGGKVLLVKREWFGENAYHTPGTYIAPGETLLEAAQRCADKELNVRVVRADPIGIPINHPDNPRFHDLATLLFCEIEGEPQTGEWFSAEPPMLKVQREYWQYIEPLLGDRR